MAYTGNVPQTNPSCIVQCSQNTDLTPFWLLSPRSILAQSDLAAPLKKAKLIVNEDEAPMHHRFVYEAVNRTFKAILRSVEPFGGMVMVFGGDFRQTLPVVPRGSRAQIVSASMNRSDVWAQVKVLRLTENMRVKTLQGMPPVKPFSSSGCLAQVKSQPYLFIV